MAGDLQLLPAVSLLDALADRPAEEFVEQLKWFQIWLQHLAGGLDPEIALSEGGVELLAERVAALPDNIALAWRTAGESVRATIS